MILKLVRHSESTPTPSQEEVWRVHVGRPESAAPEQDLLPAALLAPEIEVAHPYQFEEFRVRVQRLAHTHPESSREPTVQTVLPLRIRHAQGESMEQVAIQARQAAIMAASEFVDLVRGAFTDAAHLHVRLE